MHTEKPETFASAWPVDSAPRPSATPRPDEAITPAPFVEQPAPQPAPLDRGAPDLYGGQAPEPKSMPLSPGSVAFDPSGTPR